MCNYFMIELNMLFNLLKLNAANSTPIELAITST